MTSLANSESPLKRTEELISPLLEDFRFEAGVSTPAGLGADKYVFAGDRIKFLETCPIHKLSVITLEGF